LLRLKKKEKKEKKSHVVRLIIRDTNELLAIADVTICLWKENKLRTGPSWHRIASMSPLQWPGPASSQHHQHM
jgi:hypothetical protein